MTVLKQAPESKFAYVVLVAARARQLMIGGRPLVDNPRGRKNTRVAEEELMQGMLEYELPAFFSEAEEKEGKRRKS